MIIGSYLVCVVSLLSCQPIVTTVNLIDHLDQPINLIQSRSFPLIGSFVIVFGRSPVSESLTSRRFFDFHGFPVTSCHEVTVLSPIIIIFIRNFPSSRQRNPFPESCRQTVLRIRSVVLVVLVQD